MNKLGKRNYLLVSSGVKIEGSFNPEEIMCYFEEQLYVDQYDEIYGFLNWCHRNDKRFGSGNYEEVFAEYKAWHNKELVEAVDSSLLTLKRKETDKPPAGW